MKKLATLMLTLSLLIHSTTVSAANGYSRFSLQLDYIPLTVLSVINWFGESATLVNGAGISICWRGEDRWGAQGFGSYHRFQDSGAVHAMALGGNAVYHFLDDIDAKIDPYMLLGAQLLISLEDRKGAFNGTLPLIGFGAGAKFSITEHFGFHTDVTANPFLLVLPLVIIEGKAGIVFSF